MNYKGYTDKLPTCPGYYWVCPVMVTGPERIAEVCADGNGKLRLAIQRDLLTGMEGYRYAGPIPDPAQLGELHDAKKEVDDYRKGIASTIISLQQLACGITEDKWSKSGRVEGK